MNPNQNEEHFGSMQCLGLLHNPFPVAPDDIHFYMSETIEEIITEIVHGVVTRKGFIILTGDVGLGKTTISRRIISILESKAITTSLVLHTSLQEIELLRAINKDFGLPCGSSDDGMGVQIQRLNDFLLSQHTREKNCAIIIDDAQNLNQASLELVRMISNLEVAGQKLVQVLLVGQTELISTLNANTMRQLRSRIAIRKMVCPLSRDELRNYIAFKFSTAGGQGRICVTQPALWRIHGFTGGNFRKVNMLMDRCLYALYTYGDSNRITRRLVSAAISDLHAGKRQFKNKAPALAASVAAALMLAAGSWVVHLNTGRGAMAAKLPVSRSFKVPQEVDSSAFVQSPSGLSDTVSTTRVERQSGGVDAAVASFLNIYQLDRYTSQFQRALKEGSLDSLAQRIYADTGYQLIRLPKMAEGIRRKYGALAFTLAPGEPPTWLLFWRPTLVLKRFYYSYQGNEIYRLQKLFSNVNLYRYHLDGIVGGRLMNAVVAFQKQSGLPVTGFPDAATIFRLCHREGGSSDA